MRNVRIHLTHERIHLRNVRTELKHSVKYVQCCHGVAEKNLLLPQFVLHIVTKIMPMSLVSEVLSVKSNFILSGYMKVSLFNHATNFSSDSQYHECQSSNRLILLENVLLV